MILFLTEQVNPDSLSYLTEQVNPDSLSYLSTTEFNSFLNNSTSKYKNETTTGLVEISSQRIYLWLFEPCWQQIKNGTLLFHPLSVILNKESKRDPMFLATVCLLSGYRRNASGLSVN